MEHFLVKIVLALILVSVITVTTLYITGVIGKTTTAAPSPTTTSTTVDPGTDKPEDKTTTTTTTHEPIILGTQDPGVNSWFSDFIKSLNAGKIFGISVGVVLLGVLVVGVLYYVFAGKGSANVSPEEEKVLDDGKGVYKRLKRTAKRVFKRAKNAEEEASKLSEEEARRLSMESRKSRGSQE